MKPTTEVWCEMRSIGQPEKTQRIHGTVKMVSLEILKFLLTAYMKSRIEIILAMTEEGLVRDRSRKPQVESLLSEFDELLAGLDLDSNEGDN